jgi:phosphate uptake regulator
MRGCHNLEHATDRVINICERVVFIVTGKLMEMDVEQGETSCTKSLG